VCDVADAVERTLVTASSQGQVYELGGPHIYTYRALIEMLLKETRRKRLLLPMPYQAWHVLARLLMLLPDPPLTSDAVTLMRGDNVVGPGVLRFSDLGISPTPLEAELPAILGPRK
jgi:NADH dehydrogenase